MGLGDVGRTKVPLAHGSCGSWRRSPGGRVGASGAPRLARRRAGGPASGIDIYPAHETHTPGSQYVVIRNDGKRESSDIWVMAGDLLYQFENLHGNNEADPYYVPVGLGSGSQTNMLLAVDEMVKRAHGEMRRVIPAHEEGLKTVFPSRTAKSGLRVTEIALADGEQSRVA